jgi:hypothetical protein
MVACDTDLQTNLDLQTNIEKVLAAGAAPMTATAIAQALPLGGRPSSTALKSLLRFMVESGRVVRAAGRADAYAAPLRSTGRADAHAAALRSTDLLASVGPELDRLVAGFAARGLSVESVQAAMRRHLGAAAPQQPAPPEASRAPGTAPADAVIAAMHRLEPRVNEGAAVAIARLREALTPLCDKASFDAALLTLLERGLVELQSHAWPARLTAEDKALLIDNGQGGWFDSAALRRPS